MTPFFAYNRNFKMITSLLVLLSLLLIGWFNGGETPRSHRITMNNSSDHSLPAAEMWTWSASFLLESIAIIFLNSITVYIFILNQRKTLKRMRYLLINLALADLTVGISTGCFAVENQISSYTGVKPTGIGCLSVDFLSETASLTFLVVIALERMHAVFWSLRHRLARTRTYLYFICLGWLFPAVTMVTFILSNMGLIGMIAAMSFYVITMILLPVTICVVYFIIWLRLKHNKKQNIGRHCNMENRKLTSTLLIASILSVATWLPISATLLVQVFCQNCLSLHAKIRIVYAARIFQYLNSFLNPVVYSLRIPEFKDKLIHLGCRYRRHPWKSSEKAVPTSLELSANVVLKSVTPIFTK